MNPGGSVRELFQGVKKVTSVDIRSAENPFLTGIFT